MRPVSIAVVTLFLLNGDATAQSGGGTAVLAGTVVADGSQLSIVSAEIWLPALTRSVFSNDSVELSRTLRGVAP